MTRLLTCFVVSLPKWLTAKPEPLINLIYFLLINLRLLTDSVPPPKACKMHQTASFHAKIKNKLWRGHSPDPCPVEVWGRSFPVREGKGRGSRFPPPQTRLLGAFDTSIFAPTAPRRWEFLATPLSTTHYPERHRLHWEILNRWARHGMKWSLSQSNK